MAEERVPAQHGITTGGTTVEEYHKKWAGRGGVGSGLEDEGEHPLETIERQALTLLGDIVDDRQEISGTWADSPNSRRALHNYAVLCGNWGGNLAGEGEQEHMENDLLESPATVLCLQEVTESLCEVLKYSNFLGYPHPILQSGETAPN